MNDAALNRCDEEGLTSDNIARLDRELFEVAGEYYPESSAEIEQIYEALVKELRATVRNRDQQIARLEAEIARLRAQLARRSG